MTCMKERNFNQSAKNEGALILVLANVVAEHLTFHDRFRFRLELDTLRPKLQAYVFRLSLLHKSNSSSSESISNLILFNSLS